MGIWKYIAIFGAGFVLGTICGDWYRRKKTEDQVDEAWDEARYAAEKYLKAYDQMINRVPEDPVLMMDEEGRLTISKGEGEELSSEDIDKLCEPTEEDIKIFDRILAEEAKAYREEKEKENMKWTDDDLVFSEMPQEYYERKGYHIISPEERDNDEAVQCDFYHVHDCTYYRPSKILYSDLDNDILNPTDGLNENCREKWLSDDHALGKYEGLEPNEIIIRNDYKRVLMDILVLDEPFPQMDEIAEYMEDTYDDYDNRVTVIKQTIR